jgi:hypothetical protein
VQQEWQRKWSDAYRRPNQASTETTLDKQLLTYSFFSKLGTRLLKGLPALMRLSRMPATSLETLGPPRAPGPLDNGWRTGGGGDGEERKDGGGPRVDGSRERAAALLSIGE